MYLGIDIGGTKTLVACFDKDGIMQQDVRFPTPQNYSIFLVVLAEAVDKISTKNFLGCCTAVPGFIDREKGVGKAFGNLPWKNVTIQKDIKSIVKCPTIIENDANIAGVSEALLAQEYSRVLYITISTGIGSGFVVNGTLDPALLDSEIGLMTIEYQDKLQRWQDFASGKAIVKRFGKRAEDIHDTKTWKIIAHAVALGVIDAIAALQPEVIIFGGGVSTCFERLQPHLEAELKKYNTPMTPTPKIMKAQRPNEAVIYGCFDLLQQTAGGHR